MKKDKRICIVKQKNKGAFAVRNKGRDCVIMVVDITIIMGIYNCEKTLEEALNSIINQTYENWKLIMCDDCSKDNTRLIAENYVKNYPEKFELLYNDRNEGLNYTLNKCLEHVSSKYVARMDGDDVSMPSRLEKEFDFLESHPQIAFVSCIMRLFDEHGDWGIVPIIEYPQKRDVCSGRTLFCHGGCMIRKEALDKVSGYTVSPRLLRVEDKHLWFKLYAAGFYGANINEVLYKLRDDRNAFRRRTWSNRKNACYCQFIGFRLLKMPIYSYIYVLKYVVLELLKGIVPAAIYEMLHRKKFANERMEERGYE